MAIQIDAATKQALQAPVKQLRAEITWTEDDQTHTLTSEDEIISIKKEAEGYQFASAMRKITITATGTSAVLQDQAVQVNIKVKLQDNSWGNLPWGTFTITETAINKDKGTTTYTGYGGVYKLQQQEYRAGDLTFPTTIKGLAEELTAARGLTLDTDLTNYPNANAPISEDLWAQITGTTYRDIIEEIAGAMGSLAVISGGDDGLDFKLPTTTAIDTMTEDNLVTFKIGASWGPANAVVLTRQPQGDNIEVFDEQSVLANGRTDVTIANNEILDDQRETTAQPLLNAVLGWNYREATMKTEGHGYHEIGDRIDVTIDGQTFPVFITKSTITVDGGISETLTSTIPESIAIDYAKSGGITKTIYNTELAVDKQNQEIIGIVSRQDQTDETIAENYTRLLQTINNIQATVQVSGGGNLIKNSVGYGKQADGTLTIWQYGTGADTSNVRSQSSTASLNAGAISAYEIDLASTSISQDIQLTAGETYNLSCRIQKSAVGTATVTITDGTNTQTITAQDQVAYNWNQLDADFTPTTGAVTVTLTTTNGTASFTDLMLAQGGKTAWRQASGEIYNLQVSVDQDGVLVKSGTYAGDYVQITPLEFAGYSNASGTTKKVFTVNRDTTEVTKIQVENMIKMPPLEIVPINNATFRGWAIVKTA